MKAIGKSAFITIFDGDRKVAEGAFRLEDVCAAAHTGRLEVTLQ
jgi:hypothetical protein